MLIEIKCSANLTKHASEWLKETYMLINSFDQAYQIVVSDPATWVTPDLQAMGVPENECLIYALDYLCSLDLPYSCEALGQGSYGSGIAVQKYLTAFTTLEAVILELGRKADYIEPFTKEEIFELKSNISSALGDLVYAFSRVLFMQNPRWIVLSPEEFTYSQDITEFFASVNMTAEDVANRLIELQATYISTIPLFENDPEAWEAITKELDASLVDLLMDYGEYITALDVRAIRSGYMPMNENFVDLIRERADTPSHVSNQIPDKWSKFIQLIPDNEVPFFLNHEFELTPDLINNALREGAITEEYMKFLYTFLGDTGRATTTNVFDSNNG